MNESHQLVVFLVAGQQFALELSSVQRIVRAVEVTNLPEAPDAVLGVINVEGQVIPVVDSRRRLGLPGRELDINDLFIIVKEGGHTLALVADEVRPVVELPRSQVVESGEVALGEGLVRGVAKVDEGMIVVLGLENALSTSDRHRVDRALGWK